MNQLTPPPSGIRDPAVYDYLYQLQEYLRVQMNSAAATGGVAGATGGTAVPAALQEQYQTLRSLIIKTADAVEEHTRIDLAGLRELASGLGDLIQGDNGLSARLADVESSYVAQSDFGTYRQQIAQEISINRDGLEQKIRAVEEMAAATEAVSADLQAYRTETEGYIRSGIVYYEGGQPVIGVAIGQNLTVQGKTEDGTDIIEQTGFRAIYGAKELSFWQDAIKVAYMSNNQLYITNVTALSSLKIGRWDMTDTQQAGLVVKWIGV